MQNKTISKKEGVKDFLNNYRTVNFLWPAVGIPFHFLFTVSLLNNMTSEIQVCFFSHIKVFSMRTVTEFCFVLFHRLL